MRPAVAVRVAAFGSLPDGVAHVRGRLGDDGVLLGLADGELAAYGERLAGGRQATASAAA